MRRPSEDEVAHARRVREALTPYVSEARQQRIRDVLDARTRSVTVVLEDVVNDHNGAAVLRTADALGLMEVHLILGPSGFKASRKVAQGSQKWLEAERHPNVETCYRTLRTRGFEIWASALHGSPSRRASVFDLPTDRAVALVFGNEHDGLSQAAVDGADGVFHVPMYGFVESFNISVAAALSVFSAVQARRSAGALSGLEPEDRALVEAQWYVQSVRAAEELLLREGLDLPGVLTPEVELVEDDRP